MSGKYSKMKSWMRILFMLCTASSAASRSVPGGSSEEICAAASLECCSFPVHSMEFKECSYKHGCVPVCNLIATVNTGSFDFSNNCVSAWECCSLEFRSERFQKCCNAHGCCPRCDLLWPKGCMHYNKIYKLGEVILFDPKKCLKQKCVAEVSSDPPYVTPVITEIFHDFGESGSYCENRNPGHCIDAYGIFRVERTEWFSAITCEKCRCYAGEISCSPAKPICKLPPHPNCVQVPYGCCPLWECSGQINGCPDENSFNRVCVHFFDQCETNHDCEFGESCCLVAGCGHECMKLCKDSEGNIRKPGEVWHNPNNPHQKFECFEGEVRLETTHTIAGSDPILPPKNPYDCLLRSGLNLSEIGDNIEVLVRTSEVLPLKTPQDLVNGFRDLRRNQSLIMDELEADTIESKATRLKWESVLRISERSTIEQQISSLSGGDTALKVNSAINRFVSEVSDPVEKDSPTAKHQNAFKRTHPIATQMAEMGVVMETATKDFMGRLRVPTSASGALTLVGDVFDCTERFKNFLRPKLAPACDPRSPFRTLDGTCNNLINDLNGAAFTKFRRILDQDYGNDISSPRLSSQDLQLPSARLISTTVNNKNNIASTFSSFHFTFGQFIDHDLTATPIGKGYRGSNIKCCDDLKRKFSNADEELDKIINVINQITSELNFTTNSVFTDSSVKEALHETDQRLNDILSVGQEVFNTMIELPERLRIIGDIQLPPIKVNLRPRSPECFPIPIPKDDPFYSHHYQTCMEFVRSIPAPMCTFGPREQLNQHTAYLDGSVIYGVTKSEMGVLRLFEDGLLKMQVTLEGKHLLPAEEERDDGCNVDENYDSGKFCFKAGDGRVNEQVLLTIVQTVWAREHNRVAKILKSFNNIGWDDERLFQEARRIVVAELQHVTYNEFLPTVIGNILMSVLQLHPQSYGQHTEDYDNSIDASIANSFATAAYRFGHSEVSDFIHRINKYGLVHSQLLSSLFFHPFSLYEENTVEDLARGGLSHSAAKVDAYFSEEVTGKLFKGPHAFGLDLVALNIQRGRDHGLPGYVEWKSLCGLPASDFDDLISVMDSDIVESLKEVYEELADVDLFIGGIAERPFLDGILGPTFSCIVADQFLRIKKGDRFWYEYKNGPGAFSKAQLKQLHRVTLARILCNNIPELKRIQREPLKQPSDSNPILWCGNKDIPDYSLSPWNKFGFTSNNP